MSRISKGVFCKPILMVMLISISLYSTGCSLFAPSTELVNVTCTEPDAVLMINGVRYKSPAQVRVKRNQLLSIQAYKEGFFPCQRTIDHHMSTTGVLDVIGLFFFLFPGIGIFFPGAWSLDETDITIQLFPKQ